MAKYLLKNFLVLLLTVYCVISITFFLMHLAPGGPYSDERSYSPEIENELLNKYSVRDNTLKQYIFYIKNVFSLDFGPSLKYKDMEVLEIIKTALPVSAAIGSSAFLISLFGGIIIGYFSGRYNNYFWGNIFHFISVLGISMPVFALAIIAISIFSFWLKILPVAGWGGLKNIILPAFVLSVPYIAYISNLFRSAYLKTVREEYIYYARARKISGAKIFFKYVFRKAVTPVISFSGPTLAGLLTGSIVIENAFSIPGLGTHFVNSAFSRDYTLLFGMISVYSVILLALNFVSDTILKIMGKRNSKLDE